MKTFADPIPRLAVWMIVCLPATLSASPEDEQWATAVQHYTRSQWPQAEKELHGLLTRFPHHPERATASFYLAEAMVQQGKLQAAEPQFVAFLKSYPQHRFARHALFRAGELAHMNGSQADAVKLLDRYLQQYPQDELHVYVLPYFAESILESGDGNRAAALFQEALRKYPQGPLADSCRLGLARAQERQGDPAAAQITYEVLCQSSGPLAVKATLQLGILLYNQGQQEQAIERFQALLLEAPDSPLRPHAWYWLAMAHGSRDRWNEAHEALKHLADLEPEHELAAGVTFWLGHCLRQQDEPLQAIEQFRRVPRDWPESAWVDDAMLAEIQLALEGVGESDVEALAEAFPQRCGDSPRIDEFAQCLGRWRLQQKDFDRAAEIFQQQLERADGQPMGTESSEDLQRTRYYLAMAERGRGDPQRSLQQLERIDMAGISADLAAEIDECAAQAIYEMGWTQLDSGKGQAAAETFGRFIERFPEHELAAEVGLLRGKALGMVGQPEASLEAYLAVVADPASAESGAAAILEAARLMEQGGDREQAAELLCRLIDQQPPPKRRDAALYRLAWILADQKQAEAAATRFRQLVDEHPDSEYFADALYRCAERAARMQHTDEAARMLAQLLKTPGPEEIRMHALYLQGQLAATAGRWEDVLPPMQRLLSEFPESKLQQPATYWIAEARFRQQEYTEADAWFSQIGTGEDAREWLAMVAVRRAQIRLHAQDWDAAYEMASEIEQRFPEFRQQYEADFVVGRCLAMRARFDEARERYERVIRSPSGGRTETAAMAQWMIGESYLHQKQYDQALRAFARVESLYAYPRWQAAALLQAGKCLQHQGDREQAARCFSRVVSEYPQSTFAEEAEQRLAGSEPAAREASGSSTHRVTDQANLQ